MGKGINRVYSSFGKIVRVDLSNRMWILEDIDPEMIKKFIGGIGLASKILFEETGPHVDPLSPQNIVIVSAGLLNGAEAPTAYRSEITTKSPLTGIIGSGNFGGVFGSKLRKAGYEAIVLKGKADDPVYLIIEDDHIELKSAKHLWGKDTWETTDAIKERVGRDFSVMAIGQAGENLVRFACPVIDYHHTPGRSHAGCVMGSKNLKAIVVRGTKEIHVALPEMFKETVEEIQERIKDYPERGPRLKIGSTHIVAEAAKRGILGGKNYQTGILPESNVLWRPEDYAKYLIEGPIFCGQCLLSTYYGCNITIDVKEGKFKGLYIQGAGFSHHVWNWGSKCAIESFPAILKCKEICNRYGMDQAGPIPFALELFQRGIITREDLDGDELEWGDADAIIDMLSKIAHRRGFGDILADGSARAAKTIGREAEKYALTIKGMEMMSGADPRGVGMATNLGHLTCVRGGDDLKTTHTILENIPNWATKQGITEENYIRWFLNRLDMFDGVKKDIYGVPPRVGTSTYTRESIVLMTKWYEDMTFIRDALGICLFAVNYTNTIGPTYCAKLFSAYTGLNISPTEMMKAGERILNLIKAFNIREGLTRIDDDFPSRFYSEPLKKGSSEGAALSRVYINRLLDTYYRLRGWNVKTGNPTEEKLGGLGLEDVAEDLVKRKLI
jgi:aldehyde:ferredoxin oxidoreductase